MPSEPLRLACQSFAPSIRRCRRPAYAAQLNSQGIHVMGNGISIRRGSAWTPMTEQPAGLSPASTASPGWSTSPGSVPAQRPAAPAQGQKARPDNKPAPSQPRPWLLQPAAWRTLPRAHRVPNRCQARRHAPGRRRQLHTSLPLPPTRTRTLRGPRPMANALHRLRRAPVQKKASLSKR